LPSIGSRRFLTSTVPSTPNQRRLLIVDGHGSHVKARFIACCIQNKIDLKVLPAHSSHITQPLEVGIFAPLKAQWLGGPTGGPLSILDELQRQTGAQIWFRQD